MHAHIENGAVSNVIVADDAFASAHGYQQVPDGVGIGWTTPDGGKTWTAPASATPPAPPDPDAVLVAAITAATTLDQLKAALVGSVSGGKGRPKVAAQR